MATTSLLRMRDDERVVEIFWRERTSHGLECFVCIITVDGLIYKQLEIHSE